jgi:hypothetical protein
LASFTLLPFTEIWTTIHTIFPVPKIQCNSNSTTHHNTNGQIILRVVVHNLGVRLVETGSQVSLGKGQTNGIGNTLTKRASRHLDSGGLEVLGVTGGATSPLPELLQILFLSQPRPPSASLYNHALPTVRNLNQAEQYLTSYLLPISFAPHVKKRHLLV